VLAVRGDEVFELVADTHAATSRAAEQADSLIVG
jgi:hypothetical protein